MGDKGSRDVQQWKLWIESSAPDFTSAPERWRNKLSPFQKLMLVRAVRPERTAFARKQLVAKELGDVFCQREPFDLRTTFDESNARSPIVFVLSPGADPTAMLLSLAKV